MIKKLYWENNFIIFSISELILDSTQTAIAAQASVRYSYLALYLFHSLQPIGNRILYNAIFHE